MQKEKSLFLIIIPYIDLIWFGLLLYSPRLLPLSNLWKNYKFSIAEALYKIFCFPIEIKRYPRRRACFFCAIWIVTKNEPYDVIMKKLVCLVGIRIIFYAY